MSYWITLKQSLHLIFFTNNSLMVPGVSPHFWMLYYADCSKVPIVPLCQYMLEMTPHPEDQNLQILQEWDLA